MSRATTLDPLVAGLRPVLQPGVFVFVSIPCEDETVLSPPTVFASIREPEGLSVVLREDEARRLALSPRFRAAWITLSVHSELHAVGLTAAFSTALAGAGISCNVIAGVMHDHLFVPVEAAEQAMVVLRDLQHHPVRAASGS